MTIKELTAQISKDPAVRRALTRESHFWFFHVFLSEYIGYPVALFHREMLELTQNNNRPLTVVMAFRESGKSTIMNLSYALWAVLGKPKKKFIVIVSNTANQAQGHFANILRELKSNILLASDLGPFEVDDNTRSLILKIPDAKIMAISREQSIRGMRFGSWRPDLIIADDVEDSCSIGLRQERDSTYKWFTNELMPSGAKHTNIIVLGNLLHEDSLLMRLRKRITENPGLGLFKAYPLLDDMDQILWPGKFSTMAEIESLKKSIPDSSVWHKEYLLQYNLISIIDIVGSDGKEDSHKPIQKLGHYQISAPKENPRILIELVERLEAEAEREKEPLGGYRIDKLST